MLRPTPLGPVRGDSMVEINKHRGLRCTKIQDPKYNLACTVNAHSKIIPTAATKALDFLGMARAAKRIIYYKELPYCQSYGFSLLQPPLCHYLGNYPPFQGGQGGRNFGD
jgi:hypothetical protein